MLLNCLKRIAGLKLPVQVADPREMETLAVLKAAGLVMVSIPPLGMHEPGNSGLMPATVLGLTPKGKRVLLNDKREVPRVDVSQVGLMRSVFEAFRLHPH